MSLKDFQNLDDQQLAEKASELRRHLFELRTQGVTEKIKDVSQFAKTRKDIARILTLQKQRELGKK